MFAQDVHLRTTYALKSSFFCFMVYLGCRHKIAVDTYFGTALIVARLIGGRHALAAPVAEPSRGAELGAVANADPRAQVRHRCRWRSRLRCGEGSVLVALSAACDISFDHLLWCVHFTR